MKTIVVGSLISLTLITSAAIADEQEDKAKQLKTGQDVPVSQWTRELKGLSLAFRPKDKIDVEDGIAKFLEQVANSLDDKVLKLTGKVFSWSWKDGVAHVTIELAGTSNPERLLKADFHPTYAVKVDKDTVKTFTKGQSFELRAIVDSYRGLFGNPRNAQKIVLFTRHNHSSIPTYIGFSATTYEIEIGGKAYVGSHQVNP